MKTFTEETFVEVRRRKEVPFFQVENDVVDYEIFDDIYQFTAYTVLSRLANQKGHAFPSNKTLAKMCYCGQTKIKETLKGLEEKGLIDIVRDRYASNGAQLPNLIYINEIPTNLLTEESYFFKKAPGRPTTRGGSPRDTEQEQKEQEQYKQEQNNNSADHSIKVNGPKKKKKPVVVVENSDLEKLLENKKIKVNQKVLNKWRSLEDDETIIQAIQDAVGKPNVQNIIGYITRMLEHGYQPSRPSKGDVPDYMTTRNQKGVEISGDDRKEVASMLLALNEITEREYEEMLNQ